MRIELGAKPRVLSCPRPRYLAALVLAACTGLVQPSGAQTPPGQVNFVTVSAGAFHTCALTGDGSAYCWGLNFSGQLGAPTTESCEYQGTEVPCSRIPVAVSGGMRFETVEAGFNHTCALAADSTAYCWGENIWGQLGTERDVSDCDVVGGGGMPLTFPCSREPLPVGGDLRLSSVSAGAYHSCGGTANGAAYCWGSNDFGQLGSSAARDLCGPAGTRQEPCGKTPGAVAGDVSFESLAAGFTLSCGLSAEGESYCWGSNYRRTPVAVGGSRMNALSAGSDKICGLGEDGTAYCWGLFRLTVGDMVTRHVKPQATAIANWATDPEPEIEALRFVSISTGGQHACGVTLDGIARCWGDNSSYQLGIGGSGVFGGGVKPGGFEPERVKGDHRFAAVSAGRLHTCGVSRDGRAFCWGHNDLGQLGNGSTNEKDEPTLVTWEP